MRRLSLIGVLVLAVGMVVACGGAVRPHNAKCCMCGHEYTIPQHKGDVAWLKTYNCPGCGFGYPAQMLYDKKNDAGN